MKLQDLYKITEADDEEKPARGRLEDEDSEIEGDDTPEVSAPDAVPADEPEDSTPDDTPDVPADDAPVQDEVPVEDETPTKDVGSVAKEEGFKKGTDMMFAFGKTRKVTTLTKDETLDGLKLTLQYVINPETGSWSFRACLKGQTEEDMVEFATGEDPSSLIAHLEKKKKITATAAVEYLRPPASPEEVTESAKEADVDGALECLTKAYRQLSTSDFFSPDGKSTLKQVYNALHGALMKSDMEWYHGAYERMLAKYPDVTSELVDEMFAHAKVKTVDAFNQKFKLHEGVNEAVDAADRTLYWSYRGYVGDKLFNRADKMSAMTSPGKMVGQKIFSWLTQKGFGPGYHNTSGVYHSFQKSVFKSEEDKRDAKESLKDLDLSSVTIYPDEAAFKTAMEKAKVLQKEKNKQNPY
jgi:hypothetical protein